MRIVFMGTPDFAAASLDALLKNGYNIAGVFTQPDKAKGRGMEISFSPVKELALENEIPVFQPAKMRDGAALSILQSLKPDLVVVVAYGRILPDDILSVPPLGTINVHGSLLPRYRGAAPIQWSVLNGDKKTGVTTMYLSSEMDAGDIIFSEETEAGCAPRTPQDETQATYVSMLDKSLSPLDFTKPARAVVKWVCGLQPWPVASAELGGVVLKIYSARLTHRHTGAVPGSIVSTGKDGIEIACGDGETVLLTEVQAPGKKRMPAVDYLRGHKL